MTNEQDLRNLESFDADQTVCEADMTREILSAYLDGELDDSTRRELETRLVNEPALQDELAAMERTWNLLDTLESEEVQESFSQSTLEMVAVSASQDLEQQQSESIRGQRRRWAATASGLVALTAAGFLLIALFFPRPNDDLLHDVPILVHLDAYCLIDDVAFLERLHEEELFAEESAGVSSSTIEDTGNATDALPSPAAPPFQEVSFSSISSETSFDVRHDWIETLPVEEKYELHRAHERFESMTEEEQSALHDLYIAIESSPDADALLDVMLRYHDWLSSLTKRGMSGERSQLARLPIDDRIEKIRELQEQELTESTEYSRRDPRMFFLPPPPLQNEDVSLIAPLVLATADGLVEQLKERVPQSDRDRSEAEFRGMRFSSNAEIRKLLSLRHWTSFNVNNGPEPFLTEGPAPEGQSALSEAPLMPAELREIREELSPEARLFLEECSTEAQQWQCLVDMVISDRMDRMYHMDRMYRRETDPFNNAELAEFLENELEPDDREMVLAIPSTDEMYATMIRLYYGLTRPGGGAQFPFGPGTGSRGPGGGMGPGGMNPGGGMRDSPGQGRGGMGAGPGRANGPNGQGQQGQQGQGRSGGPRSEQSGDQNPTEAVRPLE